MTNENRELFRKILAFLTSDVAKKGKKEFGSKKFSFENLVRVERDDLIRNENKESMTRLAENKKLSRQHIYRIRDRK